MIYDASEGTRGLGGQFLVFGGMMNDLHDFDNSFWRIVCWRMDLWQTFFCHSPPRPPSPPARLLCLRDVLSLQIVVSGPAGFVFHIESLLAELRIPPEAVVLLDWCTIEALDDAYIGGGVFCSRASPSFALPVTLLIFIGVLALLNRLTIIAFVLQDFYRWWSILGTWYV